MIDFKLQQFSGPLDLLLNLIGEEKLDISEVSLSNVTEQYLIYLDQLVEDPSASSAGSLQADAQGKAEEMADFLLIAARLLLLKSKRLLPQFLPEEAEGPSLADQLRLYQAFVKASHKLNKRWLSDNRSSFRVEPPRHQTEFIPPKNLNLKNLQDSLVKLLKRIQPLPDLPQTRIDKTVSIKERVEHIRNLLKKAEKVSFYDLLKDNNSRSEVITSFLALLELVKQESVTLSQQDNFSDIFIERN